VHGYTDYVEDAGAPVRRREAAWPGFVLVLGLGPPLRIADGAKPEDAAPYTSFVAGIGERWAVTEHDGRQQGVQVDVTPAAARLLLRTPMHDVANRVVALDDALGASTRELVERLAEAPSAPARFALLDAALLSRLAGADPAPPSLKDAWRLLVESGGRARVTDVAREAGWSRRHLTALFREHVGVSPKALARLVRFDAARRRILAGERLADVAYGAGYADQAHMNRDFRAFVGCPPTELLARRLPHGGIGDGDLPSVQDAAPLAA
jgi:AraC-like DNA-binding protein